MNERTIQKMLGPTTRRIANMLVRGSVVLADASAKMQKLQVNLLAGEPAEGMEHFEPFGFTSRPKQGAEVLAMFFDGDRSHGVVIMAADRRYRLKLLEYGEVALYDDQGQFVHLKQGGQIHVKALTKLTIEAPDVEIIGNLKVNGQIVGDENVTAAKEVQDQGGAKSMSGMRTAFNNHQHPGDSGGTTGTPGGGM